MKTVFNVILGLCALALIYICYASIMGPINFEEAKKHREKAVIARLMDIRKAQMEYRALNNQQYTASFDSLIDFVKNQKMRGTAHLIFSLYLSAHLCYNIRLN